MNLIRSVYMEIKFRDPEVFFSSGFAFSSFFFLLIAGGVSSDPQINLLNKVCTQYNVTNPYNFASDLNATFSDLRRAVLSSSHFAIAEPANFSEPIYALFQCREYLSVADCLSCFSAAVTELRNCSTAHGARVVYDGCFLRYESDRFFDQTTLTGDVELCGNEMAPETGRFNASARGLLEDLVAETPKINGYFAAARRDGVYGVAQCAETVNQSGCGYCLKLAYCNIQVCLPATQGRAVDAGCFLRYSNTRFFGAYQTIDLAAFNRREGSIKKNGIIGGLVGGASFLLLVFILILVTNERSPHLGMPCSSLGRLHHEREQDGIVNFRHKDLKSATKNFSEKNKLEGGSGDLYMGLLKNGKRVAVQKLSITQDHRVKACIEKELDLVSRIWHRNLVRLLGWCSKGPELLIVYEFVANKSLEKFLFGGGSGTLNWKQRFDVIVGIAQGLRYLHAEFGVRIIHHNIDSCNIFLDDDLRPKIANLGLSRLDLECQGHLSTTRYVGTLRYEAPKCLILNQLSEKVDTYSFGVVVLEIISGRRSYDIKHEPDAQCLLELAWDLYETDSLMRLVDEKLDKNEYQEDEMKKVIEIALLCTLSTVSSRPAMSEVEVLLLKGKVTSRILTRSARPSFIVANNGAQGDISSSTESSSSFTGSSSSSTGSSSIANARTKIGDVVRRLRVCLERRGKESDNFDNLNLELQKIIG